MRCLSLMLLLVNYGQAQSKKQGDTLATRFPNHGKISGDTVFFKYIPIDLTRFFLRNFRVAVGTKGYELGYCTLFFVIDTSGAVTHAWCEQVTNELVAKEALRLTNKLTGLKPTYIKNKPIITKVKTTIAIVDSEKVTDKDKQSDLWLTVYPAVR